MQEYMDKIRSTVLFKGFLEHEVLAALHCLQGTVKDYARKDVIFEQEALLDSAGIILYGNVLLCKENISGTRLIFSELESGDILGETALRLAQEPSGYEAVAGSTAESRSSRSAKSSGRDARPASSGRGLLRT